MNILNPHSHGRALARAPHDHRPRSRLLSTTLTETACSSDLCMYSFLRARRRVTGGWPGKKLRGSLRPRALNKRGFACHCLFCWAGARRRS